MVTAQSVPRRCARAVVEGADVEGKKARRGGQDDGEEVVDPQGEVVGRAGDRLEAGGHRLIGPGPVNDEAEGLGTDGAGRLSGQGIDPPL